MTFDYRSHIADWLRELNLFEPEMDLVIQIGDQTRTLLLAFPEIRMGIWEDPTESGETKTGDWTLWGCGTDWAIRQALGQIAVSLGTIDQDRSLIDTSRLKTLINQKLWDAAKDEVDRLIDLADNDDPILDELREYRKEIRRNLKSSTSSDQRQTETLIGQPVSQVIREDSARIRKSDLLAHHFFGFFTQRRVELDGQVDAVWSANIQSENLVVWTGCAVGSDTQTLDPSIETYPTETELLQKLLENIRSGKVVWVWDREFVLPILEKWHFRTTGKTLPTAFSNLIFDLRSLALVAFPMAQRSDKPENFCREASLRYRDDLGNGGILSAMEALLQGCTEKLNQTEPALHSAWRSLLRPFLPPEWIEKLFSCTDVYGFKDYLKRLEEIFSNLPDPVQFSQGKPEAVGLTPGDFLKKSGGFIAQMIGSDYEERKGQQEFADQVMAGLKDDRSYILEAGTGIGKTIGYLIPLLLNGKRAYVATHTKNLQEQAWTKDVPEVLHALELAGIGRSVSILKGKNNYVCLQTVSDWLEDDSKVVQNQVDAFSLAAILHWLYQTKTGWLAELGSLNNRTMVARLSRDQAASKLFEPWDELDPHRRAFEAAQSVDLVLVNHSYVFALAQKDEDSSSNVDAIVFDEAHNIEDGVTEALTFDFKPWELQVEIARLLDRTKGDQKIIGPLRPLLEFEENKHRPIVQNFGQALFALEEDINQWCQLCAQRFSELRDQRYTETGEDAFVEDPDYPVLFSNDRFWIEPLHTSAQELLRRLVDLLSIGDTLIEEMPRYKALPKQIPSIITAFIQKIEDNSQALQKILDFNDDEAVRWGEARVQIDENGSPRLFANQLIWQGILHSTPIDVSKWLRNTLYTKYPHKIFVSATLAMGEQFENIEDKLGLIAEEAEEQPVTHVFPSPFNYRDHVFLTVFSDAAYPTNTTDTLYLDSIATNITELAKIGEGRTLVLFTSRKTLQQVGLRLRATLEPAGILPLMQTEGNRAALVERFRAAFNNGEKLVLLGLRAFWEGVDIPGDPLQILVITRLPFDYAGHPVALARQQHFLRNNPDGDYFRKVVVPGTFLHLRQMYGRLIRKESDRGVCVFLDPRVADKRYGRYLLNLLPLSQHMSAPRDLCLEQVKRFLNGQQVASEYIEAEPIFTSEALSSEQLSIVNAPDKKILVRAAAGSGKTRVLIERIIRIIQQGKAPDPTKILALTYTNKAQDVMQERLEQSLGPKAYDLEGNILTYHKLAFHILKRDRQVGNDIPLVNEDSPEEIELFQYARLQSDLSEKDLSDEDARTIIAFAQNGLVDEEQLERDLNSLNSYTRQLAVFYLSYVSKLRVKDWIDYGEAIVRAVSILRKDTNKHQYWSKIYDWIFCDEYQDTSPAQSRLLDLIGQRANLFVVGDSAQSIYSWMGADPDNLQQFVVDFPGTITYHLSKNYRNFPHLVRVSNRFLERCGQKHGIRVIWDEKRSNENQNVFYLASNTDGAEAKEVVLLAKEALEIDIPGEPPRKGSVGVLARKWDLLNALELELVRQEVSYGFEGETARGLCKETKIQTAIKRAISIITQANSQQDPGDTADGKLVLLIRNGQVKSAADLLNRVIAILGFNDLDNGPQSNYRRILSALGDKPASALITVFDDNNEKAKVVLSTVHSQKGEEFDTVFVLGLEKGNSPHNPPKSHAQILEWRKVVQKYSLASWQKELTEEDLQRIYQQEEERIFYVAMTRARLNLIVGYSEIRNNKKFAASEFLEKAKISGAVRDSLSASEINLAKSSGEVAEDGYRPEGRLYWTIAGIRVRSKSEALLANEFSRRGIFFEYELPPDNIAGVLPDFVMPDYGDVIIEHLGLLDDEGYRDRWEQKDEEYRQAGRFFLATNENQIKDVESTVDNLQQAMQAWVKEKFGSERLTIIGRIEHIRRVEGIKIGRPVGNFMNGVFVVEDPTSTGLTFIDVIPERETEHDSFTQKIGIDLASLEWKDQIIEGVPVKILKKGK